MSGFFFLVGVYFVLETLCDNDNKEKGIQVVQLESSMEIVTPDGFDLSTFMSGRLAKDDEERLR